MSHEIAFLDRIFVKFAFLLHCTFLFLQKKLNFGDYFSNSQILLATKCLSGKRTSQFGDGPKNVNILGCLTFLKNELGRKNPFYTISKVFQKRMKELDIEINYIDPKNLDKHCFDNNLISFFDVPNNGYKP